MYEKRKSGVQASLDFLFYARRTSNSHHKRYSYSLLGPGTLTAHRRFHLVLLHSCPDTVHGVLLRKTQTSTSLIEGSFAMKKPSDWHHPRCSGLRVQGTAISPAAHCLVYGISGGMSRILWWADGSSVRPGGSVGETCGGEGSLRIALGGYNDSTAFLHYFKECCKRICELKYWYSTSIIYSKARK